MFERINKYRTHRKHTKLLGYAQLPKQCKILDVSCGDGSFIGLLHKSNAKLELFGADVSPMAVQRASETQPYAHFIPANASALPFPDAYFDVIFCNMSLHHYTEGKKALEEMHRVLTTSGTLYMMDIVPKNKLIQAISNYIGCYEPYHFEKFYTVAELQVMAEENRLRLMSWKRLAFFPTLLAMSFNKINQTSP